MDAASLSNPQTLNLYAYCGNDPINHVDPAGTSFFGKLFGWIGKIFKWVAIAAIVAVAVLTVVGGASAGTVLAKIFIWSIHHPILASLIGLHSPQWAIINLASREGATAAGFWAMAGVGAVHDFLAQRKEQKKEEKKLDTKLFISRYFRAFGKKLNECINKVFNNPQIPKIDESNAPDVNFSKDSHELGKMVDWSGQKNPPPLEQRQAFGMPAPNEGKNGTVYIANDGVNSDSDFIHIFYSYTHEVGNILSKKFTGSSYTYGDPKGRGQIKDTDSGAVLDDCVHSSK